MQRRIPRAEYLAAKLACAQKILQQMERHNLAPMQIQKETTRAYLAGEQDKAVSMSDLTHYKRGTSLPGGAKLKALAAVLKCNADDLVPVKLQAGRVLVARGYDGTSNDNFKCTTTDSKEFIGHQVVELRITLPAAKAQALVQAMGRQNIIEHMRRHGATEDKIKETLDGDGAVPQV